MAKQSETLTAFYRAYAAWLDEGAPEHPTLSRGYGLCQNLCNYCDDAGLSRAEVCEAIDDLDTQFIDAGFEPNYPFNPGRSAEYLKEKYAGERHDGECHLNPARIAWVREHAA